MKTFPLHPKQQRDLADFLRELTEHGVRFAIVGAWAVMAQTGKIRATKDIDIYIASDDENLVRVAKAMATFGAPPQLCAVVELRPKDDAEFSGVHFGLPPNARATRRISARSKS